MILAFAEPDDDLVTQVFSRLTHVSTLRMGRNDLVNQELSWEFPTPETPACLICEDSRIPVTELSGVLVRTLPEKLLSVGKETDAEYLQVEWNAAMIGFLAALPCTVINRPVPLRKLVHPILAAHAKDFTSAGLHLPDMLVTSSADEAEHFLARHSKRVSVLLPSGIHGGGSPLSSPCCLIATPDGASNRIYVVGAKAYCDSAIPDVLAARCVHAARLLGLSFAAMQIVSTPDRDVLFELDEFPQPGAGSDVVAGALAQLLLAAELPA